MNKKIVGFLEASVLPIVSAYLVYAHNITDNLLWFLTYTIVGVFMFFLLAGSFVHGLKMLTE